MIKLPDVEYKSVRIRNLYCYNNQVIYQRSDNSYREIVPDSCGKVTVNTKSSRIRMKEDKLLCLIQRAVDELACETLYEDEN